MAKECLEAECVMKTRENRGLSIIGIGLLSGEGEGGGGVGGRRNSFPSTGLFFGVCAQAREKDNDSLVGSTPLLLASLELQRGSLSHRRSEKKKKRAMRCWFLTV